MDYFFFLASKHRRLPAVLYQGFLSTKTQVLQFTELRVIRISSAVISGRLLWSTLARLFNTYTPKANFMTTWHQTMWFSRTGLVILIPWSLTLGRAPQLMRQWRTQWQRLNRKSTANPFLTFHKKLSIQPGHKLLQQCLLICQVGSTCLQWRSLKKFGSKAWNYEKPGTFRGSSSQTTT